MSLGWCCCCCCSVESYMYSHTREANLILHARHAACRQPNGTPRQCDTTRTRIGWLRRLLSRSWHCLTAHPARLQRLYGWQHRPRPRLQTRPTLRPWPAAVTAARCTGRAALRAACIDVCATPAMTARRARTRRVPMHVPPMASAWTAPACAMPTMPASTAACAPARETGAPARDSAT